MIGMYIYGDIYVCVSIYIHLCLSNCVTLSTYPHLCLKIPGEIPELRTLPRVFRE